MSETVGQPGKNGPDGAGLVGHPSGTIPPVTALAGYWCLQCNNAAKNQRHVCAGPVIVAGRRYACTCKENHNG